MDLRNIWPILIIIIIISYYIKDILDYIGVYIFRNIIKIIVRQNYIKLLIENLLDQECSKMLTFTISVKVD